MAFAISSGDPAGIGPEIIGKSWQRRMDDALSPFFMVGDATALARHWDGPVQVISDLAHVDEVFDTHLPILEIHDGRLNIPGQPSYDGALAALQSLETALGLVKSGSADGLVTGPISKAHMRQVGFTHPGQTEFIAERCGVSKTNATMMLAGPTLRVVPVTVHVPLRDVPQLLTIELIKARAYATHKGLIRNFGIAAPRLVIAGFNPHAGESGQMGDEEIRIITPAVAELRDEGLDIIGPLSADAMFHAPARAKYDAALCIYHDQALIPLKTLHFADGVNMTLGLPIIRTSPDHGTAFDIAGKNIADPSSMVAAIKMAAAAHIHRQTHDG